MTGARFDDGKDDGALRTIGEVSRALDIKTHVLRYWEQQFPMLDPLKRSGGRRYYRADDVAVIERINRLVNGEGYTIKGAQQVLASDRNKPSEGSDPTPEDTPVVGSVAENRDGNISKLEIIGKLKRLRSRLAEAIDA